MALALPVAFAACTNEEFENDVLKNDARELLSKDFSIIAEKTGAPESRGQWQQVIEGENVSYKFNWINATAADKIGLCWTGVATSADGTDVSVVNPNNMALSNYEFELTHYTNGKAVGATGYAEAGYEAQKTTGFSAAATYNNYQSAKFAVTGVTPFTGEYVMYYPYSTALKNVGYLPVYVSANQTVEDMDVDAQLVAFGNVTTCISNPYNFDSKTSATDVKLYPYTTGFMPKMVMDDATGATAADVKRIMLVAADGKNIINEQTLDLAGNVKTSKGVNVITLTLPNGVNVNSTTVPQTALMAVLPQTLALGEFEILFVNAESKAYSYPLTNNLTLAAGSIRAPKVKLDGRKFTMDIISDEVALKKAINAVTTSEATISTYKNVPVTVLSSTYTLTNKKKVTVNAEKIVFYGTPNFMGDIEFNCPVEFRDGLRVGEGATVTLADGTVFTAGTLTMDPKNGTKTSTLNLKATTINSAVAVDVEGAVVNFTSGSSDLNAVFNVGANLVVNIKNGATVNVKVADGLLNNGTVNVEQGGILAVAATYTANLITINPSITNNKNLNVYGTLINKNVINNANVSVLKTEGNGVINNEKTINNFGNIVMMQTEGVALNQIAGATVEDNGNISGISRISGGDVVITTDNLEAALANPKFTNHTAFRTSAATTVDTKVNTTKKLILAHDTYFAFAGEGEHNVGSIEIAGDVSLGSVKKLNVNGDMSIAAGKTLTVGYNVYIKVTGKIYNNGTFTMLDKTNSYVGCSGIVSGTGAVWNPTPQW